MPPNEVLRRNLDMAANAGVEGSDLDDAAHMLRCWEAQHAALAELHHAVLRNDKARLEAALAAAEAVCEHNKEIETARHALQSWGASCVELHLQAPLTRAEM